MNTRTIFGFPVVETARPPCPSECVFDAAWDRAEQVFGWLTEPEAEALYRAATAVPIGGTVIEVGSFCGRSTTLLAASGRNIIAVDPLEIGRSVAKVRITDATVAAFKDVVLRSMNVQWIRRPSLACEVPSRIDMLYIDGQHNWPHPLDDFKHFSSGLVANAVVAFHDFRTEFGVTETVTKLERDGRLIRKSVAGSMYIGEFLV